MSLDVGSEKLTEQYTVGFTEAEGKRVQALARQLGCTRAKAIRAAVLRTLEELDSATPAPTQKRRKKP